jgi:DNA-binding transcriptional LysR family regulator
MFTAMETRLLKMFSAVAESGGLVAAAARLHLTPSALSHGIKALEGQLGCRLFDRAGKRMLLNQAGEQFLNSIRPALVSLDEAAESIRRLGKWGHTRLRIGAAASICQHILPGVIRELKKSLDRIELQVRSGDTPEVMEMVKTRKLDLAIGVTPENQTGLEVRPLFRDELMFVFAPGHPWASGRPIPQEELKTQPLILYQHASATAGLVDGFFGALKVVPSTVMEVGNVEAIKELVKLNLGVSVLAPWAADKELVRGSLKMRPVGARPLTRNWVVISQAGRRLTLTEESFCKLCRQQASGMRLDRKDVPVLRG